MILGCPQAENRCSRRISVPDARQIIALIISIIVPISLLFLKNRRLLLIWISIIFCVNIFDTTIGVNLFSARLFGLILLPITLQELRSVLRTSSGLSLFLLIGYTLFLGILFGFLFPWPEGDFDRAYNQTANGRAIFYSLRLISDFSLVIFLKKLLTIEDGLNLLARYLIVGTTFSAAGGLVQKLSGIDIYFLITGLTYDFSDLGRVRGFNYEPRGLGLIMTYGIVLLLLQYFSRPRLLWLGLLFFHGLVFFFATSTSALIVLTTSVAILILLHIHRNGFIKKFSILISCLFCLAAFFFYFEKAGYSNWLWNIEQRLLAEQRGNLAPESWFEYVIFHMEYFDGPAVVFLVNNPAYLVIGTGPGLIPLPASSYLPALELYDEMRITGLHYPPTIGLLLEISNSGLIGLLFWIAYWLYSVRAFNQLIDRRVIPFDVRLARDAFIMMGVIYALQVPAASAIWTAFLSMGPTAEAIKSLHCNNNLAENPSL